MTPAQSALIRKCVAAFHYAEQQRQNGEGHRDDELVEVGWIAGVNPRTAESLVSAGILVYDMPSWASEVTNDHARFPRMDELQR